MTSPSAESPQALLGVAEVAARLDLTPERVRQLLKARQIDPPRFAHGREVFWTRMPRRRDAT